MGHGRILFLEAFDELEGQLHQRSGGRMAEDVILTKVIHVTGRVSYGRG